MPVDRIRDIRNSIYQRVRDLLEAPPADSGVGAYRVYGEVELRQAQDGSLARVYPSVFLVNAPVRPVALALPLVSIVTTVRARPHELGNVKGKTFRADINIFGRQKNEASLLASFLQDRLRPIAIYDWQYPEGPDYTETALLEPEIDVVPGPAVSDAQRQQGAFDHWDVVIVRGATKDA